MTWHTNTTGRSSDRAEFPTDAEIVAELRRLAAHPNTIPQVVPQFFTLVADRLSIHSRSETEADHG